MCDDEGVCVAVAARDVYHAVGGERGHRRRHPAVVRPRPAMSRPPAAPAAPATPAAAAPRVDGTGASHRGAVVLTTRHRRDRLAGQHLEEGGGGAGAAGHTRGSVELVGHHAWVCHQGSMCIILGVGRRTGVSRSSEVSRSPGVSRSSGSQLHGCIMQNVQQLLEMIIYKWSSDQCFQLQNTNTVVYIIHYIIYIILVSTKRTQT